ncbi:MAG: sulfate permease [Rhodothermales bacterium]|nr:sulfate permease [Rhodothermales bacterium]
MIAGLPSPYNRAQLKGDLVAGLTVGVMVIPQAMAYAVLAGVPPVYGLYASLVPLGIYALLGTSRQVAAGVVAIDSLIVVAAIAPLAERGSLEFVAAAVVLAGLTGVIQIALGVARFGFLVALLSRPVISGFASAAAITIGLSQVPGLIGADLEGLPTLWRLVDDVGALVSGAHLISSAIGFGAIALLILLRRWKPGIPSALVAVVAGTLIVWQLKLDGSGVDIVAEIPHGLPAFQVPRSSLGLIGDLVPTAVALALIQFTTLISLGKTFARKNGYRLDANRELITVGAMNLIGSFFRSIPVSGSFSRTAVADRAGARSSLANLFAMLLVAVTLLFLTPAFHYLPIPIFAAIIMVAAFGMVDWKEIRDLFRSKQVDGWIAVTTFGVTLLVGIQEGILTGIVASIIAIMFRITRPDMVELGRLEGTDLYRALNRREDTQRIKGVYILRFDASFSFANADYIRDHILHYVENTPGTRALVLDATSINDLDMTAAEALSEIVDTLRENGIAIAIAGVKGRVADVLKSSGLAGEVGQDNFYLSVHRAVDALQRSWEGSPGNGDTLE